MGSPQPLWVTLLVGLLSVCVSFILSHLQLRYQLRRRRREDLHDSVVETIEEVAKAATDLILAKPGTAVLPEDVGRIDQMMGKLQRECAALLRLGDLETSHLRANFTQFRATVTSRLDSQDRPQAEPAVLKAIEAATNKLRLAIN
jgi:hypothetical protein